MSCMVASTILLLSEQLCTFSHSRVRCQAMFVSYRSFPVLIDGLFDAFCVQHIKVMVVYMFLGLSSLESHNSSAHYGQRYSLRSRHVCNESLRLAFVE